MLGGVCLYETSRQLNPFDSLRSRRGTPHANPDRRVPVSENNLAMWQKRRSEMYRKKGCDTHLGYLGGVVYSITIVQKDTLEVSGQLPKGAAGLMVSFHMGLPLLRGNTAAAGRLLPGTV